MVRIKSRGAISALLDLIMFGGLLAFLLLLPFHLVIKRVIPGPVGTYWKEGLLGLLLLLWAIQSFLMRRPLLTKTPADAPRLGGETLGGETPPLQSRVRALNWAVLIYVGVLLLRFALDRSWWVGTWGLYVSIMYLPLFWLVPAVLQRRPARLMALITLMVGVAALISLGGLAEFVWNVPLWPSDEMALRQGFPGVFIYGTNIRRVYFTFDSPTTLANTLAMLLPLAVALILVSKRLLARLAAGLAAALLAACIVVTFSRGIWIATVISLAAMGAWIVLSSRSRHRFLERRGVESRSRSGVESRSRSGAEPRSRPGGGGTSNWRSLLVVGGALALVALAWGAAWLAWRQWEDSTYEGVVELSPAAFEAAPLMGISQELLQTEPVYGQAITQTWSLLDPITAQDDARLVLYEHPPETGKVEVIYLVTVPENGALRFAIALSPEVWSPEKGDGASFQVYVAGVDTPQEGQPVFVRYINPKYNPSDRRWRNFLVDLSPWAGRTVHLSLLTDAGRAGDWAFDWAGWAEPQVVNVEPGYFASNQAENAIVRHTSSILDWARDETNRDRLAAWSQALDAWRKAPLWGTGLGTTGVAALRTHPERAFVTESQVLKALVELGPLGLLALAYLWFQIARVGYRTYRAAAPERLRDFADRCGQTLLLGILTGLLVAFIEGLVYQNLEVKQVNAYFWTLVGTVAFLAGRRAISPSDE